jgi:leader peptidase (prepilin peptidase)/N-methyltransferase
MLKRIFSLTAIEYTFLITGSLSLAILYFEPNNAEFLQGIIWNIAFGMTIGNYATSFVARLPNNIPSLTGAKPYCMNCNTNLSVIDLFPIFSYLSSGGKCRYCSYHIPKKHLYVELTVIAAYIASYLIYGFSELYFIFSLFCTSVIILCAIYLTTKKFEESIFLTSLLLVVMYRVLIDGSIYGVFVGSIIGFIIGMILSFFYSLLAKNRSSIPLRSYIHSRFIHIVILVTLWVMPKI